MATNSVPVLKDPNKQRPVPTAWRPELRKLADAIASLGDGGGLFSAADIKRFRANVAAYPATLGPLPDRTWKTSVAQWMEGHWEVLVDLYDSGGELTDLVMMTRVAERSDGYVFYVQSVHVP